MGDARQVARSVAARASCACLHGGAASCSACSCGAATAWWHALATAAVSRVGRLGTGFRRGATRAPGGGCELGKCLKEENNLRLSWLVLKAHVIPSDALLSNDIFKCMLRLAQNGGKSESPFVIDAATCIEKEAGLIIKFMGQGCEVPNSQYILSQNIRRWALKLLMFKGNWSSDIAAVLVGIIKEAELLLENIRSGSSDAIDTSSKIRRFALEFLCYKFDEIGESDEMTSNVDDDVVANEVNRPTWDLAGEFEKNKVEKKHDNKDKQPKETNNGSDTSSSKEGDLPWNYIVATEYV